MGDELTFAEAMALDPSEVEVQINQTGDFVPLDKYKYLKLMELRVSHFRLTRPKRSRVQEMANSNRYAYNNVACHHFGDELIRAVCEYIRTKSRGYRDHDGQVAEEVEREFLDPRSPSE